MSEIRGVLTAMVSPFDSNGGLDLQTARSLAKHLVDNGSHGIVVAGTTGESPTLSDAEQIDLLDAVLEEVGDRATVICGTGSNHTRHAVEMTRQAAGAGAHAALVVTPYYNNPNPAGLRAHFAEVASASDLPIILYNIPSRSVINMSPDFMAELAADNETIVAVKQANNEELQQIEGLDLLAGNDEVFMRTLELGGVGGILVSANLIPDRMREVFDAAEAGDLVHAAVLNAKLSPIYEAMTVTANPIPIKAALEMAGLCTPGLRLPMVAADDDQRAEIRAVLEREGVLAAGD